MADDTKSGQFAWPMSKDGRPMQFSLPKDLVETILLGPADDRRVLQDSPLLGDVWAAYALDPGNVQDVLITPHRATTAAGVANLIPRGREIWDETRNALPKPTPKPRNKVLGDEINAKPELESAKIAYLQGLVAAELYFDEVLCILVPLTQWWRLPQIESRILQIGDRRKQLTDLLLSPAPAVKPADENYSSLERYIALAGLIFWIGRLERPEGYQGSEPLPGKRLRSTMPRLPKLTVEDAVKLYEPWRDEIVGGMLTLYETVRKNVQTVLASVSDQDDGDARTEGFIFQISLNRKATTALDRSVPSVKADAATSLFKVKCNKIVWAVIDSGIDRTHPAFNVEDDNVRDDAQAKEPQSRVRKTFDFTRIREIISNNVHDLETDDIERLATAAGLPVDEAKQHLRDIAADFREKRPVNWAKVEKLITLKDVKPPTNPHGTHVAGIIGANGEAAKRAQTNGKKTMTYSGMCPDIRLYDFRVLGNSDANTEFAVISALQYIRYVNERHNFINIHGVNLSLSIPHDVRNFACGRTPICNECERMVESGVVVVAAAGNRGFQKYETAEGPFESYAAFSITDPGNGEGVITVGSTHGNWPYTYGVSFFSSRGPTGDGRLKPDLVAPGERVYSTVLEHGWAPESGTSMAAPHVSGAAAMLLARYDELVGQPRRVKQILCDSATDLGRERSFQGHGMLDVLRALQSI